jgi:transposase
LGKSSRDMIEGLIAGERDPKVLVQLAYCNTKTKHAVLVEALTGRFDDHHAELARILLDQIDTLTGKITSLTARVDQLIAAIPAAEAPEQIVDADISGELVDLTRIPLAALARLDEITGIGVVVAQTVIAGVGLNMGQFRTAGHVVSWAKISPRTIQSGPKSRSGQTGKGNPYLKGALGEAAAAASRTNTFPGERFRRIVKRHGKLKASLPWPAPSSSSSGTSWPTLPLASPTSVPTSTNGASTRTAEPVTSSASSKRLATR